VLIQNVVLCYLDLEMVIHIHLAKCYLDLEVGMNIDTSAIERSRDG